MNVGSGYVITVKALNIPASFHRMVERTVSGLINRM